MFQSALFGLVEDQQKIMENSEKEKAQLIELTKKKIKKHMLISAFLGVVGILLFFIEGMAFVGVVVLGIAVVWGIIARFRAWWEHG